MSTRKTFVILELPPQKESVYFVVESGVYDHQTGLEAVVGHEDRNERLKYYFEQHTCPTNYVQCKAIIAHHSLGVAAYLREWDDDPHGLLKFKGEIEDFEGSDDDSGLVNWVEKLQAVE